MPIPLSLVARGGSVAKNVFNALKSGVSKVIGKTPTTTTGKEFLTKVGVTAGAYQGAKYGFSGDPKDLIPSGQSLANIASYTASPIPSAIGTIQAFGQKSVEMGDSFKDSIFNKAKESIQQFKPEPRPLPRSDINNPTPSASEFLPTDYGKATQDLFNNIASIMKENSNPSFNVQAPNVNIQSPPVPSFSGGSFSPSVQVGGGGSEILPLLLLLAGGTGLGYAIGKKKKKYKRRKKRK